MPPRPPEDELVALVRALIIAEGVTTANGNIGGTSFIDASLIGAVGIVNTTAVLFPGQPLQAQVRDTTVFNAATGEVTVSAAFSAQVPAGTPYVILAAPPTVAEVAAIAANLLLLMADVGDASGSTLGSLYAILGNPPAAQTFLAMIGYEGATALANKLTAARAAELDPANIPADTDPKVMGRLQIKATTIDLGQAAGTYDLFTGTTQDVVVEKLSIRMSGGTLVGSNLTSILIQTDDATPIVLIDALAGAVANLTDEAQLAWTGAILLDAGTGAKIRLTIAGGAATAAKICDVIAECRAVVAGGYLA